MNKRDNTDHFLDGALIKPLGAGGPIQLRRYLPSPALSGVVRHFWFVSWDLPVGQTYIQPVLPLPAVNAVVEQDGAWVYGVWSRRYDKVLSGRGSAFGTLFTPTGFFPLCRSSVHELTDRRSAFDDVLRVGESRLADAQRCQRLCASFEAGLTDVQGVAALEQFWIECARGEAAATELQAWVTSIEQDPELIRVEQLAERHGVGVRTLQRAMRRVVGLGPKQLIRRYRLLEAASQLATGAACDQVGLALALGYADQSHFARDFRAVIGTSPGRQSKQALATAPGATVPHPSVVTRSSGG